MVKRRKRSKKWISWLIILILLCVAIVVIYLVWEDYFKGNDGIEYEEPEVSLVEEEYENKMEDEEEEVEVEKETVKQYEGEDPNNNEELTGVITYAGVSGNNFLVRVNIDQYLANGECILNILKASQVVYSDTADVVDSAATATCEGFNVPLDKVGIGELEITITVNSGNKKGIIKGGASI